MREEGRPIWTSENRSKYDRNKLRYPSDLTDEEWSIVGPLIPDAKGGGNKRTVDIRAVLNEVMYILSTGCQWAALGRGPDARSHSPCALRSVPGAGRARGQPDGRDHRQPEREERGKRGTCIDPSGYDAGKKIKGKKRHVLVDTQGLLMQADIQDRDSGVLLMGSLIGLYPSR